MSSANESIPFNFGGLSGQYSDPKKARYSVLPVPYDLTASYISGMRGGPKAIIEASTHMELYDEELGCEPFTAGIETLGQLESTTAGPEAMIKKVRDAVSGMLRRKKIPVMFGGEHSISFGMAKALKEKYPSLSVIQFDAHADMRDDYQESPFNHACVARRISEICPITQVGIRSLSVEEAAFLKKEAARKNSNIRTYYAGAIRRKGPGVWDEIADGLGKDIFVTIDLDVFDPSILPATGTPEPGGLYWYEVLELLRKISSRKRIVGFDIVELCPIAGNIAPDFLAAKLAYKIMGYINESLD